VKINLHIDQIVVDGPLLTRRERDHLATTLEQELTHQLRQRAADGRGTPARAARRGDGGQGGSPLGIRIAHDVLAALPVDALAGGSPARVLPTGRRRPRPVAPGAGR
jgi:hypothetical protein